LLKRFDAERDGIGIRALSRPVDRNLMAGLEGFLIRAHGSLKL
jgi:hypothetical protein